MNKDDFKNLVIDLNNELFAVITFSNIYLIRKNNYIIAKTIKLKFPKDFISNYPLKISDNYIIFFLFGKEFSMISYRISMEGIKWEELETKNILNKKIKAFYFLDKKHILLRAENKNFIMEKIFEKDKK